MEKQPCVYILASKPWGTLYIGVTTDLTRRMYQHRNGLMNGFAARYRVARLVRFEMLRNMEQAITREKQLKNWHRPWKVNLILSENPEWADLAVSLGFAPLKDGA